MTDRATFAADELAVVLSHYDLGTLRRIKEFPRGSRQSPKVLIRAKQGDYILKRRALGKNDPFKVAFSHALQLFLATRNFPLPHLIGTREHNNSMLQSGAHVYELFEFIHGTSYDHSLEETADAGRVLAIYHRLVRDYEHEFEPPQGSYHASPVVERGLAQIPETLLRVVAQPPTAPELLSGPPDDEPLPGASPVAAADPARASEMDAIVTTLRAAYNQAAEQAVSLGLDDWPKQIVHCDWHPGNAIFRDQKVIAVIDYDAARLQQRAIDVANGALQFSMVGGTGDPSTWPEDLDRPRFDAFLRGYESAQTAGEPPGPLLVPEHQAVPWLMIEALIAESVVPVAATGMFGRLPGLPFLRMIARKVGWLAEHAEELGQSPLEKP